MFLNKVFYCLYTKHRPIVTKKFSTLTYKSDITKYYVSLSERWEFLLNNISIITVLVVKFKEITNYCKE